MSALKFPKPNYYSYECTFIDTQFRNWTFDSETPLITLCLHRCFDIDVAYN